MATRKRNNGTDPSKRAARVANCQAERDALDAAAADLIEKAAAKATADAEYQVALAEHQIASTNLQVCLLLGG